MLSPRALILRGPGTNCDQETAYAFERAGGHTKRIHVQALAQSPSLLDDFQIFCIPGGFSYGDDIASGRILALELTERLGDTLRRFHERGGLVLGICNGFQILIESGLLDGALMRNSSLSFICRDILIKSKNQDSIFTKNSKVAKMPIAHNEGNFFATAEQLKKIQDNDQIAFQYCDENGNIDVRSNPNGSLENIAGILNGNKNVLGMMPHPERAAELAHGCEDGKNIFESILN